MQRDAEKSSGEFSTPYSAGMDQTTSGEEERIAVILIFFPGCLAFS